MSGERLIWTKRALALSAIGKSDPRHTISAPNVADVYEGFVRQMKTGTPWALISQDGSFIASGTAKADQ